MKVYFLSLLSDTPKRGYWDYGLLEDLLSEFPNEEVESIPSDEFAIVVIPARSHYDKVEEINKELSKIDNVLLFLMGDEEHLFPVERIKHRNIKIWVQNPEMGRHDKYGKIGTGYPQAINEYKKKEIVPEKKINSFFAGQVTHQRRVDMGANIIRIDHSDYLPSDGFAKGLPQQEYYSAMARSKTAPCPSGPETVDTFRLFEALELGCIPLPDTKTPKKDMKGFWNWLFDGEVPFPQISEWDQLFGYTDACVAQYPAGNNIVQAWWIREKQNIRMKIYNDLFALGYIVAQSPVTVLVPVSPIPSHPLTHILMQTLQSISFNLPKSRIILMFDGVRSEQEEMRADYEEHIRKTLWEISTWGNVFPIIFDKHEHQSGMMRGIIDLIDTPLVMFVEQDTPLVTDEFIDWEKIERFVVSGESNLVRLYHEGKIPQEHSSLMLGGHENGFLKTIQWSQRPHVASTAFYRRIMMENFTERSKCFLEDLLHGKVMEDYKKYGQQGWNQWRLHLYYPNEDNLKRSYHLDGREGSKKFDDSQTW